MQRQRSSPRLISVVVPVRNAAATIPALLEGLSKQTYNGDWEVIIADNGSTDDSLPVVGRWAGALPDLRVVDAADRTGAGYARNRGTEAARGDFIAYCDADDVPHPGWLDGLAGKSPDCDLVGGRVDLKHLNDSKRRSWYGEGYAEEALPHPREFLPFAGSGNLGIWRDVFERTGGWSGTDRGSEDIDFVWRAELASFRLCFAPEAIVHVRLRETMTELVRQMYRWGRSQPGLYRDFRDRGMRRSSLLQAALVWAWLIVAAPTLLWSSRRRAIWMRRAALRLGRLVGSLRSGVLFL